MNSGVRGALVELEPGDRSVASCRESHAQIDGRRFAHVDSSRLGRAAPQTARNHRRIGATTGSGEPGETSVLLVATSPAFRAIRTTSYERTSFRRRGLLCGERLPTSRSIRRTIGDESWSDISSAESEWTTSFRQNPFRPICLGTACRTKKLVIGVGVQQPTRPPSGFTTFPASRARRFATTVLASQRQCTKPLRAEIFEFNPYFERPAR